MTWPGAEWRVSARSFDRLLQQFVSFQRSLVVVVVVAGGLVGLWACGPWPWSSHPCPTPPACLPLTPCQPPAHPTSPGRGVAYHLSSKSPHDSPRRSRLSVWAERQRAKSHEPRRKSHEPGATSQRGKGSFAAGSTYPSTFRTADRVCISRCMHGIPGEPHARMGAAIIGR